MNNYITEILERIAAAEGELLTLKRMLEEFKGIIAREGKEL